jgi:serine/threonine protein kinase
MALFDSIRKRMGLGKPGASQKNEPTVRRPPPPDSAEPTRKKPAPAVQPESATYSTGDRILGRYEVRDNKAGGFGCVYLCYDHQHRLPVALKTLIEKDYSDSGVTYQDLLDKFYLEAEAWVRLEKHKHIVQAKGVERIDGRPYISLEFVSGHETYGSDLTGWLEYGPLGITQSLNFAVQFCTGMEYAAQKFEALGKPFVHRDIKPANTMVTHDGVLKITDFGLVKIFDASEKDIFRWAGTDKYMSPEQWKGLADIDYRADVYSFGCLLYAMLAGQPPFLDNYRYNHLYGTPPPLKNLVPGLPEKLNYLIMQCLAKEREQRTFEDNRPLDFTVLKRELAGLYQDLTGESIKEETALELEAWERLNKGIALCRLGFRQQAITEYLQAMAADPRAARSFIPANLSHSIEWYCPPEPQDKLVFHIQSVFSNYSQQKNMASVLGILVAQFGFKVIAVEGGSGPIDLTFYRELPDGPGKEETAHYFLKEARIQGHEYFAITTKEDILLFGAEEPGLHERHTESYKKGLPELNKWLACCDAVEKALISLKPHIYHPELKLFEAQISALEEKSLSHLNFLKALVDQFGIAERYPNLSQICESYALGQWVDQAKMKDETGKLLDFLSQHLREDAKEGLNKTLHDYRQKEISEFHFFSYLQDLIGKEFTVALLRQYPHLELYMQQVLKKGAVKLFDLFVVEVEGAEEDIRGRLYRDEEQRNLDRFLKYVRILKEAYKARLLPPYAAFLEAQRTTISGQKIVDFITEQAGNAGIRVTSGLAPQEGSIVLPAEAASLGANLWHPDSFYSLVIERSQKLIQNCLRYMEQAGESGSILVTGGFHTHKITAHLREQGIPFVVLAPDYEQSADDEERYLGAVLGCKTPFEEALEKKNGSDH